MAPATDPEKDAEVLGASDSDLDVVLGVGGEDERRFGHGGDQASEILRGGL